MAHLFFLFTISLVVLSTVIVPAQATPHRRMEIPSLDKLHKQAVENMFARMTERDRLVKAHGEISTCTVENLAVRKEFGSLSPADRKEYTDAVLCLQNKTADSPFGLVPGAKSRFDDFVATHINQTLTIHYTGTFLAWHRYFTYIYETALREECGYTGYQPYWDWPKYVDAPQDSVIFNGDEYSMGSNGEYIEGHSGIVLLDSNPNDTVYLDPGLGGGCVYSGPFANMSVNLGPVALYNATEGADDGFAYNPRCLKRDVGPATAQRFTNETEVIDLINDYDDIWDFEMIMQGIPGSGSIGVHGGGHYTIGGDPGGDLFVSPGDPAFYLHHGQIDRVWWIWQNLNASARMYAISGTGTYLNDPPSANTTLDTVISLGFAGGREVLMEDLMATDAGIFCYRYE